MLSLEFCIACVMLISLIIYMLTGGADFGGGIWDLFARQVAVRTHSARLSHTRLDPSGKRTMSG